MKKFHIQVGSSELEGLKEIVSNRLIRRGLSPSDTPEFTLTVQIDPEFRKDSYSITGKPNDVTITADSLINAFGGCGAFLYTSRYSKDGFIPSEKRGFTTPDCPFRMVYLATHFHNFFHAAPVAEVETYLEDMALMGFNSLMFDIPAINLKRTQTADMSIHFDRAACFTAKAASIGMKSGSFIRTSATFDGIPAELKADPLPDPLGRHGNSGNVVCVSRPGGQEHLDEDNRLFLSELKKRGVLLDYLFTFPYDEGGCGCEECSPWGANGYIRACKRAVKVGREFYPDSKIIVATWTFDTPECGEWEGLARSLETEKWCDIILADSHEDFPRYPLDIGVPGNLPLINFPEITMWGLNPWGGYGAVAFPRRYTRIWKQTEGKLYGEMLYSEGISEDINKYTVAGLCKDYNCLPEKSLAEYAGYEIGCGETDKFTELIDCIETNHVLYADNLQSVDIETAARAWRLAREIDTVLPEWGKTCWRWRILYIRAQLDFYRYQGVDICGRDDTDSAMHELIDIYHCIKDMSANHDPYHSRVRPICN